MSIVADFIESKAKKKRISASEWLKAAAAMAKTCTLASHVGKYSHPGTSVMMYVEPCPAETGSPYSYPGNTSTTSDLCCNAASIGTAQFLFTRLESGNTVLAELIDDTPALREELAKYTDDYDQLRSEFLSIAKAGIPDHTESRLKQVFFPVGAEEYHLLTVLTSSSYLYEFRERIRKLGQEKEIQQENSMIVTERDVIYELSAIGFGGTQPQNVSLSNMLHGGQAYLLPCFPPEQDLTRISRPHKDFFRDTLKRRAFQDTFDTYSRLRMRKDNNRWSRAALRKQESIIVDKILYRAALLKQLDGGWSDEEGFNLPETEKVWLDKAHFEERESLPEWREDIANRLSHWVVNSFRKHDSKDELGDDGIKLFREIALDNLY